MNAALMAEIATLNDVQYPRYRIAFKLRKLQKTFLLHHAEVGMVAEVLHSTGVQGMSREEEVLPTQLTSTLSELYSSIRTLHPILPTAQLQTAQQSCLEWIQVVAQCSVGHKVRAGGLKLLLCLFSGSRPGDKARYIFSLLANANGVVDREWVRYFCKVTQQLAQSFQECLYVGQSLDTIFQQSLVFVRSVEDVEDEELDGGIKRQWLSQFEFAKVFTTAPPPPFLAWMALWFHLPAQETVVHPVRCAVCSRKPVLSFRYQCAQCPSFHMCQMCFLKGRIAGKHQLNHKVVEFTSGGKGHRSWHRLLGLPSRPGPDGRVMNEPREPFTHSSKALRTVFEDTDLPLPPVTDLRNGSNRRTSPPSPSQTKTHRPAVIRIGSPSPKKAPPPSSSRPAPTLRQLQTSPAHRISLTSSSSSPDSLSSSNGGKFTFEGAPSTSISEETNTTANRGHVTHTAVASTVRGSVSPPRVHSRSPPAIAPTLKLRLQASASDGVVFDREDKTMRELSEINKRLSMEVDQLLSELPPPARPSSALSTGSQELAGSLHRLQLEEEALQSQVSQLSDKRVKLAHELSDLMTQVRHMHYGFVNLSNGVRSPSTNSLNRLSPPIGPVHIRYGSAPAPMPNQSVPAAAGSSSQHMGLPRVSTPPLRATAQYLDPLVEFTADQLSSQNHRLSVAW